MIYTPRPGDDKPQEPKPGPFPPPPPGVDRGSAAGQVLLSVACFAAVAIVFVMIARQAWW